MSAAGRAAACGVIARTLADRDALARGAQPYADTSWWHADQGEWLSSADAVLTALDAAELTVIADAE